MQDEDYGLEGSGDLQVVAVSSIKNKNGRRQPFKKFDIDVSKFRGSAISRASRAVCRLIFDLDDESQFDYYEMLPDDLAKIVSKNYERALRNGYHAYPSRYTGGEPVEKLPCNKPSRPAKAEKEMERRREKARKYLKAHGQTPLF